MFTSLLHHSSLRRSNWNDARLSIADVALAKIEGSTKLAASMIYLFRSAAICYQD